MPPAEEMINRPNYNKRRAQIQFLEAFYSQTAPTEAAAVGFVCQRLKFHDFAGSFIVPRDDDKG